MKSSTWLPTMTGMPQRKPNKLTCNDFHSLHNAANIAIVNIALAVIELLLT